LQIPAYPRNLSIVELRPKGVAILRSKQQNSHVSVVCCMAEWQAEGFTCFSSSKSC